MTTLTSNIEDSWTVKLESRLSQPPPSTLGADGNLSASSKFDAAFDSLPLLTLVVRDSQDAVVYEITLPESGPSEWLNKLEEIKTQREEANKDLDAEFLIDSVMPDPVLIEMEDHIQRLDHEIKMAIKNRDEHKVKLEEKRRLHHDAIRAESDQKKRFMEARFRHQSMALRRAAERRGIKLEGAVQLIEPPPAAVQPLPATEQPKLTSTCQPPKVAPASQQAKSQATPAALVVQQPNIQAATPQKPKPKGPPPVVTRTVATKSPATSVKKAVPVSYKVREPEALPVLPASNPKRIRRNKQKNYSQDLPDSLFSDDDDKDTLYPGQRLDETLFSDFSNLLRTQSSRLLGTASAFTELWREHSFFQKSKALLTPCWISDKLDKPVVAVALETAVMRTVLPEAPLPTIGRVAAQTTSSCGACGNVGTLGHLFNVNSSTLRVDSACAARLTIVVDYLTHLRTTVCSLRDPAQKIENVIEQHWKNFRICLQQAEDIVVK